MGGSFAVSNGLVRSSSSGRMTVFDIDAEVPDSVVLSTEVLRDRAKSRMAATLERDRTQAVQEKKDACESARRLQRAISQDSQQGEQGAHSLSVSVALIVCLTHVSNFLLLLSLCPVLGAACVGLGMLDVGKTFLLANRARKGEEHLMTKAERTARRKALFAHSEANHLSGTIPNGRDPFRPMSLHRLGLKSKSPHKIRTQEPAVTGGHAQRDRNLTRSFESLTGPSQRAVRAQGSFRWVPTVKKFDAIPYMEALEAWRSDDERADFWDRATREYYWRESQTTLKSHRPAFSGAQDLTVDGIECNSSSRSLFVDQKSKRRASGAKAANSGSSSHQATRPGSRGSADSGISSPIRPRTSPGEVNSTLMKGAGWPWPGKRRVPIEKLVERNDQQAVPVDRFGHVGAYDSYVSVRTTSDLANAANQGSIEQRDLDRYIQTVATDAGATEKSPPFTPDGDPAFSDGEFLGAGFGDWPTTWQEVHLDPLDHDMDGVSDDPITTALQRGEDVGELLQDRMRLMSLPVSTDGTKVSGFVDTQFTTHNSSTMEGKGMLQASASAPDLMRGQSPRQSLVASWEEVVAADSKAGTSDSDHARKKPAHDEERANLPPVSQRPWTAEGLADALTGTPGRTATPNDSVNNQHGRPKLNIMTREEAEVAYGLSQAAVDQSSRRSSIITVSTLDSEKETSKRLEKELERTMAKLKDIQGGPSSNELTRSSILLRSAAASPK